jgi:hypothetical protein
MNASVCYSLLDRTAAFVDTVTVTGAMDLFSNVDAQSMSTYCHSTCQSKSTSCGTECKIDGTYFITDSSAITGSGSSGDCFKPYQSYPGPKTKAGYSIAGTSPNCVVTITHATPMELKSNQIVAQYCTQNCGWLPAIPIFCGFYDCTMDLDTFNTIAPQ